MLLGPTGSGKGTQAQILEEAGGFRHVSMGEVIRARMESDPGIADELTHHHDAGRLISDELAGRLLEGVLGEVPEEADILVEGFPRNQLQIEMFDQMLERLGRRVDQAILLTVSPEEATRRLVLRGRRDDQAEAVREKLRIFEDETRPVIETYRGRGLLSEIHGEHSVAEVARDVNEVLRDL